MSRLSIILIIGLGVVGLIAVIIGAVHIVVAQTRAAAPAALAPAPLPAAAGAAAPAAMALTPSPLLMREMVRSVMPALVSIFLLIPSGVMVIKKDRPPEQQRWATATISSIVTYWLT
ncbi:MAG: hypothetical protein ACRDFW_06855 [bacterium]